ncbi:hypothetical protein [Sporofaciens musculi]|uniref:hypothetical protein n=1 Tax=Sporofaciens musculi TaxID=2681861 RepID=UPI001FCC7577|nr:hypothetical protein [Sporofaciens musculi]
MEQQYRQVPPMTPETYGKRIWHLWGPVVIKWVVGIGVGMIARGSFKHGLYDGGSGGLQSCDAE